MEDKKQTTTLKDKLHQVQKEVTDFNTSDAWKSNPYVKAGMYVTGAILIVWASQYVFAAFEGAIREYKKLRRTIKEN
jgi:hypothetical protein